MEPAIPSGSLVLVQETKPDLLEVGDVISFYSRDPSLNGSVNTHRIVSVENDGESCSFTTRGDANNVDDLYVTREEDLVGKVVYVSGFMGTCIGLLSNPLIFVPIILLPLAILLFTNLYHTVKLARKIAKEEEEKAVREAVAAIRKNRQRENGNKMG
jgi:signal peptidase I